MTTLPMTMMHIITTKITKPKIIVLRFLIKPEFFVYPSYVILEISSSSIAFSSYSTNSSNRLLEEVETFSAALIPKYIKAASINSGGTNLKVVN